MTGVQTCALPIYRSRLLIINGYKSHVTDDFIYSYFNSNIYLLFLPPYASYILQPFDLSVFGPIKIYYRTAIGNLIYQSDDCPIGKQGFLKCYSKARQAGLNEKNVLAGWKAIRLWPINRAKPLISRLFFNTAKPQLIKP